MIIKLKCMKTNKNSAISPLKFIVFPIHLLLILPLIHFKLSPLNLSGIIRTYPIYTLSIVVTSMLVSVIGLSKCIYLKPRWATYLPYINTLCFFIEYNNNLLLQMIHTIGISVSTLLILLILAINSKANHIILMIGFTGCVFSVSLTNNINMFTELVLLVVLNLSSLNLLLKTTFNKRN